MKVSGQLHRSTDGKSRTVQMKKKIRYSYAHRNFGCCRGCEKRTAACHIGCEDYATEKILATLNHAAYIRSLDDDINAVEKRRSHITRKIRNWKVKLVAEKPKNLDI